MSSCSVSYWKFVEVDSGCSGAAAAASQLSVCRVPRSQAELETHLMLWAVSMTLICQSTALWLLPAVCCLLFILLSASLPPSLFVYAAVLSVVIAHRISVIVFSSSPSFPSLFTYSFQLIWWWIMLHGVAYWLTDGCCKRQRGVFIRTSPMTFCSDTYEVF